MSPGSEIRWGVLEDVDGARLERIQRRRRVLERVDDRQLVEIRQPVLVVIGEPGENALLAGGEGLVLEGSGSDRLGRVIADRDDPEEVVGGDLVDE
jgi:hypothetical protein